MNRSRKRAVAIDDLLRRVRKTRSCWLWTAGVRGNSHKYGSVWFRGRNWSAHRVSWVLHFGEIPNGMLVLHKCDVPLCVNPAHLFTGTNQDNTQDCIRKGRRGKVCGEFNGRAVFTNRAVQLMKLVKRSGRFNYAQIGEMFGVTRQGARAAITGKNWRHL